MPRKNNKAGQKNRPAQMERRAVRREMKIAHKSDNKSRKDYK